MDSEKGNRGSLGRRDDDLREWETQPTNFRGSREGVSPCGQKGEQESFFKRFAAQGPVGWHMNLKKIAVKGVVLERTVKNTFLCVPKRSSASKNPNKIGANIKRDRRP